MDWLAYAWCYGAIWPCHTLWTVQTSGQFGNYLSYIPLADIRHNPSDIVGGAILGIAIAIGMFFLGSSPRPDRPETETELSLTRRSPELQNNYPMETYPLRSPRLPEIDTSYRARSRAYAATLYQSPQSEFGEPSRRSLDSPEPRPQLLYAEP